MRILLMWLLWSLLLRRRRQLWRLLLQLRL
jgi:hypothetical protein